MNRFCSFLVLLYGIGFSKFVDFFENKDCFVLVSEHGGVELLSYIRSIHPFKQNDKLLIREWKQYIRYHFRFIARCIYYLHIHCNVAHLDLSLENMVIDDTICRIIDFGLARKCPIGNNNKNNAKNHKNNKNRNIKWKYDGYVGKKLYQSPEIRKIKYYLLNGMRVPLDAMYDPRSADIWALGVMLFIMLIGAQPWHVAEHTDMSFDLIIKGEISFVLNEWKSHDYVEPDALGMLCVFVCISVCILSNIIVI